MNEELRINEENTIENVEYDVNYMDAIDEEGGSLKKGVGIVGGILVTGATVLAIKSRNKIKAKLEERSVKKLEKKGYTVLTPEDDGVVEVNDSEVEIINETKE